MATNLRPERYAVRHSKSSRVISTAERRARRCGEYSSRSAPARDRTLQRLVSGAGAGRARAKVLRPGDRRQLVDRAGCECPSHHGATRLGREPRPHAAGRSRQPISKPSSHNGNKRSIRPPTTSASHADNRPPPGRAYGSLTGLDPWRSSRRMVALFGTRSIAGDSQRAISPSCRSRDSTRYSCQVPVRQSKEALSVHFMATGHP